MREKTYKLENGKICEYGKSIVKRMGLKTIKKMLTILLKSF